MLRALTMHSNHGKDRGNHGLPNRDLREREDCIPTPQPIACIRDTRVIPSHDTLPIVDPC